MTTLTPTYQPVATEYEAALATRVALADDTASARDAAALLRDGWPVGQFFRSVAIIWVDGGNAGAVEHIHRVKGEKRVGRPLSTTLSADRLIPLIDPERVMPALHPIMFDADELDARISELALLRVPIKHQVVDSLPPVLVSHTDDGAYWLQNWIPSRTGHLSPILAAMAAAGIDYPAPTSMNVSGQPEIVDQVEAIAFSARHDIPMFLIDPGVNPALRGSFPIVQIDETGVSVVRIGHFAPRLLSHLLGVEVHLDSAKPAKFPLLPELAETQGLSPYALRERLLRILTG